RDHRLSREQNSANETGRCHSNHRRSRQLRSSQRTTLSEDHLEEKLQRITTPTRHSRIDEETSPSSPSQLDRCRTSQNQQDLWEAYNTLLVEWNVVNDEEVDSTMS